GLLRLLSVVDEPESIRRPVFAQIGGVSSGNPVDDLAGTLLPVYRTMDLLETRRPSQQEVALAGIAILKQRAQTGQFPIRLPGEFIDPFSGKSLLYRREGAGGFVVSSKGPGGVMGTMPGFQILFRYPPKPVAAPTPRLPRTRPQGEQHSGV
nr:hypothetical protein [Armatimonadota bacterium]